MIVKTIDVKGDVVDNDTAAMYDFFNMQNINPQSMQDSLADADGDDIMLNIASNGGDVFAASEIYTMLQQYDGQVSGTVQGLAASAASIIAMACDHLVMSPTSQLMIHRCMQQATGNTHDFEHYSDITAKVDQSIANAYMAKTGMNQEDLLQLMDKETWLTADDAVKQGFADEIMTVNNQAPQAIDSLSPLPSRSSVTKFKQMLKSTDDDKDHSALFKQKLEILKGTNNEN